MDENSKDDGERYVVATRFDHAGSIEKTNYDYDIGATGLELAYGWRLSRPLGRAQALTAAESLIKTGEATEAHVLALSAVFTRSFEVQRIDGAGVASAGYFGRMSSSEVMRDRYYEGPGRALQPANLGRTVRDDVVRNQDGGTYARERAAADQTHAAAVDEEQRVADAAFNGESDIDGEHDRSGDERPDDYAADAPRVEMRRSFLGAGVDQPAQREGQAGNQEPQT